MFEIYMNNNKEKPDEKTSRQNYPFMGAGLALGVALGAAMGNIALGLVGGVLLGALGSYLKKDQ